MHSKIRSGWFGRAGALALVGWCLGVGSAAAQTHTTGLNVTKTCPVSVYQGDLITCTATVENQDTQHGVKNLVVTNQVPFPGGPLTPLGCAATLGVSDGVLGSGVDFTSCNFNETPMVTCALGDNILIDQVAANGNDAAPSGQFANLPVSGSTTTAVVVRCCGDGSVNGGIETCDPPGDPAGSNGNTCRADCTVCGDGIQQAGEECDDGNGVNTDGCRNNCKLPFCGDGVVDPGETCDPPGSAAGAHLDLCRADCTVCGDGIQQAGEQCDDGNNINTDGCRNNCMTPTCGDGVVDPGETCDPPGSAAGPNGNTCRANCTVCGDGIPQAGEQCDDGNSNNTDGCTNACLTASCGDGVVQPGEACDPPGQPGGPNGNICYADCTVCGDGVLQPGEQCDDGNTVDTDDCHNDCTFRDNFHCYELRRRAIVPIPVTFVDERGTFTGTVIRPERLCTPASVNGSDATAPTHAGHLTLFPFKRVTPVKFAPIKDITVTSVFGTTKINIVKPEFLAVPGSKSLVAPPPPLSDPLDHFMCYRAQKARGAGITPQFNTMISDQFLLNQQRIATQIRWLCSPANKNGEEPGAELHRDHLLCYRQKLRIFSGPLPFVNDQFGQHQYEIIRREEVCVAARIVP